VGADHQVGQHLVLRLPRACDAIAPATLGRAIQHRPGVPERGLERDAAVVRDVRSTIFSVRARRTYSPKR